MTEFLLGASAFVLLMVAARPGLHPARPGRRRSHDVGRSSSAPAGIAALLLLGAAIGAAAVVDVALILAVLAAFAALAFVKAGVRPGADPAEPEDHA